MDTNETYIKMCDCEEIQALKKCKPEWGVEIEHHNYYGIHDKGGWYEMRLEDYVVFNSTVGGYVSNTPQFGCAVDSNREILIPRDNVIWLARQDQLQEMVAERNLIVLAGRFNTFCTYMGKDWKMYALNFTSMEQLWLAFVMKEKYNKIWTGEEWRID